MTPTPSSLLRCVPLLLVACFAPSSPPAEARSDAPTLLDARKGFETQLTRRVSDGHDLPAAPPELFERVQFPTPIGDMQALVSRPQKKDTRSPAIIWLVGGFPVGGVGSYAWEPAPIANDQSAKAYRLEGMIQMYPTLRGSAGNPGHQESFYGEVDDVIAAAEYLAKQDFVDPERLYLGGHSTGATLALLVAASTDRFAGVIAFGPIDEVQNYGSDVLTFDPENEKECRLRAPLHHLESIRSPTLIVEGGRGNLRALRSLQDAARKAHLGHLTFVALGEVDHFEPLAPLNDFLAKRLVAKKERALRGVGALDLEKAFLAYLAAHREAADLRTLAAYRARQHDIDREQPVRFYFYARDKGSLSSLAAFHEEEEVTLTERKDRDGDPYFELIIVKSFAPSRLSVLFDRTRLMAKVARRHEVSYDGWSLGE